MTFYLSDEYPEYHVTSPRTLGGTPLTLHLDVDGARVYFCSEGCRERFGAEQALGR